MSMDFKTIYYDNNKVELFVVALLSIPRTKLKALSCLTDRSEQRNEMRRNRDCVVFCAIFPLAIHTFRVVFFRVKSFC